MLDETLERVKQHWISEGLALGPTPDRAQLCARFIDLGIKPASEVLQVFTTLGGFANDDLDSECLTFWTIEKILTENSAVYAKDRPYVHFADFLFNSHTYAFSVAQMDRVEVHCYDNEDKIVKVANSFQDFFRYYLDELGKLFWGLEYGKQK